MKYGELTDRNAVLQAMREFDKLGREEFLIKCVFKQAKNYFVESNGKLYDSKAIVGAAFGYQFSKSGPLKPEDFSGGKRTVAPKLESLGFKVIYR
jgi:hypothetical protein